MYQLRESVLIPSAADILRLPDGFVEGMVKRRNLEQAEKCLKISLDTPLTSTFIEVFRRRLELNQDLSNAFYAKAYESHKNQHFFNLGEHCTRLRDINPYSGDKKHFTAAQQKELMALLVATFWDTYIGSSPKFPCPTLIWDSQDNVKKNYYDRAKNELHITDYRYLFGESSAQTMLACILSHSIDLTSEGKLNDGFGAYGLAKRNQISEQVRNPQTDITRAEMQALICRKASQIFMADAERATLEHLYTNITDESLRAMNSHQRNSLLINIHPVGTCYDPDGNDQKYEKSFFESEDAKYNFIIRVNANCPIDPRYLDMYNSARDSFLGSNFAHEFRSAWGAPAQNRPEKYKGEGITKLVEEALSAIENAWRNAAQESVVLTDETSLPVYFGSLEGDYWNVGHSKRRRDINITIGDKTYKVAGVNCGEGTDQRISIVPHFNCKKNFSTELYIQEEQHGDAGTYYTKETLGYIIHIAHTKDNCFWRTRADDALMYLGWLYIHALHHRIRGAFNKQSTLKPDNPFYAHAQRIGNWHNAGDLTRLDWMVSRIPGHEQQAPLQILANNFLAPR